jgi:DNA-binding NarL/FixJ family response regulator
MNIMGEKIKILYAEDKEHYRKMILSELAEYNVECIGEAGNGRELLRLLRTKKPDVVLLDLEMPVMDGNDTMKVISSEFPHVKVLILSLHYETELVDDYLSRGAFGYLSKDLICSDIGILVDALKKIKDGNTFIYQSPELGKKTFTRRQLEMIPLICHEMTNREIAGELGMQTRSVEKQRQKIYEKTNSGGATAFLKYAFKRGLDLLERKTEKSNR